MEVAQSAPTASTVELRLAAIALQRRLTGEIQTYEQRYELRSVDLEDALKSGRIHETAEVVDWVISYRTLLGLADELKAPAQ